MVARTESYPQSTDPHAAAAGVLAVVLFGVAWALLHVGFYTHKQVIDTPIYQRYGNAIADGRVRVNGRLAGLGDSADPDHDRIEVDGRPLAAAAAPIHLALHKPRGFVSSARDERGRRSVVSLVDALGESGRWARAWAPSSSQSTPRSCFRRPCSAS